MLNIFSDTTAISMGEFLTATAASLILGLVIAFVFKYKNRASQGFLVTLAVLPAIVQTLIILVNGNLGTGVAVMGAFSLIRFRSAPGNAKDICSIFLAMAVGIATGTGYILLAAILTLVICAVEIIYGFIPFLSGNNEERNLSITIPESLDYSEVFTDLFEKYTSKSDLTQVKTTNMGSLYKLNYAVVLKDPAKEKEFIDELRCRNGNLEISCGRAIFSTEQL